MQTTTNEPIIIVAMNWWFALKYALNITPFKLHNEWRIKKVENVHEQQIYASEADGRKWRMLFWHVVGHLINFSKSLRKRLSWSTLTTLIIHQREIFLNF